MEKKRKILIVDDAKEAVLMLRRFLEKDYDVAEAYNGVDALDLIEDELPDLIILDVMMPVLNGFDVCKKLKKNEKTKDIPIIFLTGKNSHKDEEEGLKLGAIDYISKPFKFHTIKMRVKNQIEMKLMREKLREQNKSLKNMLELRENMANMIVHDMRTPLNAINGFTQLLLMDKSLSEKIVKRISHIQKSGNTLSGFLNDLLMIAKTEKEKLILHCQTCNLVILSQELISMYQNNSSQVTVTFHYSSPEIIANIDSKLFYRVFDNLLSNALKFSPTKGEIVFSLLKNEKIIDIKVSDQGPGVPDEQKEKIFDTFSIVDMRHEGVSQFGLGLAFCKMVIDAHHGKISVKDNLPKGSIFHIELESDR